MKQRYWNENLQRWELYMRGFFIAALLAASFQVSAAVEESVLPSMENIYLQDFGGKINRDQKALMQKAIQNKSQKLRLMTYNMLYNAPEAEDKLPIKHRWEDRKPRLLEYLLYATADVIGSQELQEDQVQEVMSFLGNTYGYYGEITRENEGRTDINAIFYNKIRLELIDSKTIPYIDGHCQNAFTYCRFKDRSTNKEFVVLNTKLSWGNPDRRLAEAVQLNDYSSHFSSNDPVVVLGDFNLYPFILHKSNIFFDGDYVERVLAGKNLKDAKSISAFGHFGPLCSITNSRDTLEPFIGAQLIGFVLDHILVNEEVEVLAHGIDTAKVAGEFPSDHFPVIAEVSFRNN